jgi:hypothetical protein
VVCRTNKENDSVFFYEFLNEDDEGKKVREFQIFFEVIFWE